MKTKTIIYQGYKCAYTMCKRERTIKYLESKLKAFVLVCFALIIGACVRANYADNLECSKSWKVYCAKYNVDANNPSTSQVDYYLDAYVGTIEEEVDLGL